MISSNPITRIGFSGQSKPSGEKLTATPVPPPFGRPAVERVVSWKPRAL